DELRLERRDAILEHAGARRLALERRDVLALAVAQAKPELLSRDQAVAPAGALRVEAALAAGDRAQRRLESRAHLVGRSFLLGRQALRQRPAGEGGRLAGRAATPCGS